MLNSLHMESFTWNFLSNKFLFFIFREMNGKVNKILNGNHILKGKKC